MTQVEHIYVHFPFCRRHCPYCDYAVLEGVPSELDVWVEAVGGELRLREAQGLSLFQLDTILVGGGTPTVRGVEVVQGIKSVLGADRLQSVREWTVEANPDDIDSELLDGLLEAGVNRVTLGIQSLEDTALEWLGRLHTPSQAQSAIATVRDSRLSSWGIDLLFGLPEEVDPDPARSLRELIAMGVPHVSLFELTAEPGTPIGAGAVSGEVRLADEDLRAEQYLELCRLLGAAGFEAYEMMAFSRPGHRSMHAAAVLSGRSWLGLGPGAHSNLDGRRSWNLRDWPGYCTAIANESLPEAQNESASIDPDACENLWFRLRSWNGIPRTDLGSGAGDLIDRWIEMGLAAADPLTVRLTPNGWLRLDELSVELGQALAEAETPRPGADPAA